MSKPEWLEELQSLCEAAIEEKLTDEQRGRLEHLVFEHPQARRFYVEYLHQHGCLHWSNAEPALLPPMVQPATSTSPSWRSRMPRRGAYWAAALAASMLLAIWIWPRNTAPSIQPAAIATISGDKACKWGAGTLPTEVGARLTRGRLRLAEGIAQIVFDSGAEVRLEGPADLELLSRDKCILHTGRLVAKVPHKAIGFVVDTPTAVLKDLGTEFGVNVKDEKTADVQVFDGIVDVQHRSSGKTERLLTGKNKRFGATEVADFDPQAEKPAVTGKTPTGSERIVQISTATGRGKDAYVQPKYPSDHSSDILILIKNSVPEKSEYQRKGYIGLDLAAAAGMKILDAQLTFTFTPTGLGFASEVPDATFLVYGLLNQGLDSWDEKTIRWKNAPANGPGGAAVDQSKVTLLGSFQIAQGELQGTRSISGKSLVDFLNRDTNAVATFILVRKTLGSGRTDLVHGFANKHHPTLPPPTLKLSVVPK